MSGRGTRRYDLVRTPTRYRIPPGTCIHGHAGCGTPYFVAHDTWCDQCHTFHCNQPPTRITFDPLDDPSPF